MPRYYFDTHDTGLKRRDRKGVELAGVDDAIARADEVLRRVALFETPISLFRSFSIDVRDEAGSVVYHVELRADP